jgi:hypothetical protein
VRSSDCHRDVCPGLLTHRGTLRVRHDAGRAIHILRGSRDRFPDPLALLDIRGEDNPIASHDGEQHEERWHLGWSAPDGLRRHANTSIDPVLPDSVRRREVTSR